MTGRIFINYRRADEAVFTHALYLQLEQEFGADDLFMDVEGYIKPGDDFVEVLNAKVAACDIVLVVIGPRWLDLLSQRMNVPEDPVMIEIKAALDQSKRVIPVLVGGASMPQADRLPEAIRPLSRRNAVSLRPERFKADCRDLVPALKATLSAIEKERAAEREAVEAEQLMAEQAVDRVKAAEELRREQALAGLSADQIRKAEELANWNFVKGGNNIQDLRDHLARFAAGRTERYALAKLEELVWTSLGSDPTNSQLRAYLDEFPNGSRVSDAQRRIAALERNQAEVEAKAGRDRAQSEAWGHASVSNSKSLYEAYLLAWPDGWYSEAARARLKELEKHTSHSDALDFITNLLIWFMPVLVIAVISQSPSLGDVTILILMAVGIAGILLWRRYRYNRR